MSKRIAYQPITDRQWETAAKRYAIMLDGEKVGEVFMVENEPKMHGYANSRLGYSTTAKKRWYVEGEGYHFDYPSRTKAVRDFLERRKGMSYQEARLATGTKAAF